MTGFQVLTARLPGGVQRFRRVLHTLACIAAFSLASSDLAYNFCALSTNRLHLLRRPYQDALLPRAARANYISELLDDDEDRDPEVRAARRKELEEFEATASDADANTIITQAARIELDGMLARWYKRATEAGVQLEPETFTVVLTAMVRNEAGFQAVERWLGRADDAGVAVDFDPLLRAAGMNSDPMMFRHLVTLQEKQSAKRTGRKYTFGSTKEEQMESQLKEELVNKDFNSRHIS